MATTRKFKSLAELNAALERGEFAGRRMHCTVLHDDWCDANPCRCEPEFELEPLTAETFERGEERERAWRKSRQN